MNREHTEAILIGCCIKFPSLTERLNEGIFKAKTYKDMYLDIVQWHKAGATELNAIMFYGMEHKGAAKYSDFTVQSLADWIERHAPKTIESAASAITVALSKIEDNNYLSYTHGVMEQAKEHLLSGNDAVATALLKSVRYKPSPALHHTPTYMMESINESNGFPTGVAAIDDYTGGWYLGNLCSIAGDTGSMKTRSSLWLVIQILKTNPTFKAVYFEKEMPIKDISRLLVAHFCGIKNDHIMKAKGEDKEAMQKAIRLVTEQPEVKDILDRLIVIPPTSFSTAGDMWKLVEMYKANVWVLDYMSLLDGDAKSMGEKAHVVMDNVKQLKNMVHATNSFGILLNQLNKGTVEQRFNKIPMLDDIEWSGDIKKLSAYVLATFNPSLYYSHANPNDYYLVSLKNRDKKNYAVALQQKAEYCNFEVYQDDEKARAVQWLQTYIQTFQKG